MKKDITHSNRAAKRGSLNALPHDPNECRPEVGRKELSRPNTSDGRAPGVSGGKK